MSLIVSDLWAKTYIHIQDSPLHGYENVNDFSYSLEQETQMFSDDGDL